MAVVMQPHDSQAPVGILFPGALGDFICFRPALYALARQSPVEVFAKKEFSDLVGSRNVRVSTLERREISRLFAAGAELERDVRDFFSAYSHIFSWTGSRSPHVARALGALMPGKARLFPFFSSDPLIHQTDYYLSCLGLPADAAGAETISPPRESLRWSDEFWSARDLNHKAVLVIAPGSGAREKNWPAEYFADVGRWWREDLGGEVIVLLGPVEEERAGLGSLCDGFTTVRSLSLGHVAALLRKANLYIGNDSGITHLAAAIGTTTVAIFGPSSARRWRPRGPKVWWMSLGVACSPCDIGQMKSCPHRDCLTKFLPRQLMTELERRGEIANLTRWGARIRVHNGDAGVCDSGAVSRREPVILSDDRQD